MKTIVISLVAVILLSACIPPPPPPAPKDDLVAKGRILFNEETFNGNGRTCASCHPPSNNFTIDSTSIATLADDDPLFVSDFIPALKDNFENSNLIRDVGLILENQDGFDDLKNNFNQRSVPHTLAQRTSINSPTGPKTGWSGDGSPGDGSLRSFATGAVIQHFTKTLNRVADVDFRLPNENELNAMEAYQLSLGRQEEIELPLPLKSVVSARGQQIFNSPTEGKCFACHFNAGANGAPAVFGPNPGNLNFNTGVEALPDQPADLSGEFVPDDDGFGVPGNGEFNTPPLVEAADTGPFFHNNSVETIELAVAFYNGDSFNNSPAGQLLNGATGSGINLDASQVFAVAAFLRDINALENIRQSIEFLESYVNRDFLGNEVFNQLPTRAMQETDDSIMVLSGGGLHPAAVAHLKESRRQIKESLKKRSATDKLKSAIKELKMARAEIVE